MKSKPTRIGSVTRATELLVALADTPPDVRTPRTLSVAAGVALSSTYHLLNTFEDAGILSKDTSGCYQFGPTFALLAEEHFRNDRLPAPVTQAVRELAAASGESAYFSTWRQGKIEILTTALGSNAVHVAVVPGGTGGSEHARASGKLLLALSDDRTIERFLAGPLARVTERTHTDPVALRRELEQIKARGYAVEREEFLVGVGCASAPVYAFGRVYGAVTISAPIERFKAHTDALVAAVCSAAEAVQLEPDRSEDRLHAEGRPIDLSGSQADDGAAP